VSDEVTKEARQLLLQGTCRQRLVRCLLGTLLAQTRKLLLLLLAVCLLRPVRCDPSCSTLLLRPHNPVLTCAVKCCLSLPTHAAPRMVTQRVSTARATAPDMARLRCCFDSRSQHSGTCCQLRGSRLSNQPEGLWDNQQQQHRTGTCLCLSWLPARLRKLGEKGGRMKMPGWLSGRAPAAAAAAAAAGRAVCVLSEPGWQLEVVRLLLGLQGGACWLHGRTCCAAS
jgi:hypothetical protein